jgi:thioredoxin 1
MKLQTMTEAEFATEVLQAAKPVLVDFATHWCAPCRALAPVLTALVTERRGQLELKSVDAEASQALSERYDVRSFPTVIVFAGGREVARSVGLMSKDKLVRQLRL